MRLNMKKKTIIGLTVLAMVLSLLAVQQFGRAQGWRAYFVYYIPPGVSFFIAITRETIFGSAFYYFISTGAEIDRFVVNHSDNCEVIDTDADSISVNVGMREIFSGDVVYLGTYESWEPVEGDTKEVEDPPVATVIISRDRVCRVPDSEFMGIQSILENHVKSAFAIKGLNAYRSGVQ